MSCESNSSNINKTFILEPLSITGGSPTLSACTGMYTNLIIACDTENTIDLSQSGITTFNTAISADTVYGVKINKVSGGGWVIPDLNIIFNNPADWYNLLEQGQYVITTPYTVSGVASGLTSQLYELIDINQFDNQTGWQRVIDNDTTIDGYLSGTTIFFNTLSTNNAYSIDISGLDNEIHQLLTILSDGQTDITYLPPEPINKPKLKLFLNGVLQNYGLDYVINGTTITWLDSEFILNSTDLIKIIYI